MSAQKVRAGQAFYQLGLDKKEFDHGISGAVKQVQGMAAAMASAGAQIMAAGLAMMIPLKKSVDVFEQFEVAMARVKAITNATTSEFETMSEKARQLGRDTMFTAADAANGMRFFALAGFKVNEIMSLIGPTLDLAAAGMISVAEAGDITSKITRAMGLEVEQTTYLVDVLANAMVKSNTDLRMLGDAFKYVGPIAAAAGFSLEETTAAIMTLSDAGLQGSMAGTALRGAMMTMLRATGPVAARMKEIGLEAIDQKGNVRPLVDIIQQLEKSLGGLNRGAQLQALAKIFSKRELAGMAVLFRGGATNFSDKVKSVSELGTASRMAATQINTVWGAIKILESSLESVGIEIGKALMPAIRTLMAWFIDLVNAAGEWVKSNRAAVLGFAALASGLTIVGGALTAAGLGILAFTGVMGSLASVITTAWALSWNHWVMGISKATVLLMEFTSLGKETEHFLEQLGESFAHAGGIINSTVRVAQTPWN